MLGTVTSDPYRDRKEEIKVRKSKGKSYERTEKHSEESVIESYILIDNGEKPMKKKTVHWEEPHSFDSSVISEEVLDVLASSLHSRTDELTSSNGKELPADIRAYIRESKIRTQSVHLC
jgi:hypothetical protein